MLLEPLRTRVVSWAIRDSIPWINLVRRPVHTTPWPTLDALRSFPPSSFGRAVAAFLDARGLPFLDRYENHDALHLLLGYDTTARGELELQAFMWANGAASFAGRVLFVWGAMMLPEHIGAMRVAFARGRRIARVAERDLPERLREPLESVSCP